VEFGQRPCFPRGVVAAGCGLEPVRDFEESKGGRFVQSEGKATACRCGSGRDRRDPQARDKIGG